jgi:hypothetical protein
MDVSVRGILGVYDLGGIYHALPTLYPLWQLDATDSLGLVETETG